MNDTNNHYPTKTDEELMLAYQEGDAKAFDELYDRTSDRLYGYLERRLSSPELVDEVFQNALTKFHQTRFQYRPPLPVLPWLFTICRTVMIDALREQGRRQESYREDMDKYEDTGVDFHASPAVDGFSSGTLGGMRTLSQPQREALALRFEHDFSFEEIAKQLETSPTNARQLISRALRKLKSFANKKAEND